MKNFKTLSDYLAISIGIALIALGNYLFLFPYNLTIGGLGGLSIILKDIFPLLSLGVFMTIVNFVLFVVSFMLIGKDFGSKTIYGSFGLSFAYWGLELLLPNKNLHIVNDTFLNLIFGVALYGVGIAIVFFRNGSTGGTDIGAKIISEKTNLKIGKSLLLIDITIVLLGTITFGIQLVLYAFAGKVIHTFFIDTSTTCLEAFRNTIKKSNFMLKMFRTIINKKMFGLNRLFN